MDAGLPRVEVSERFMIERAAIKRCHARNYSRVR